MTDLTECSKMLLKVKTSNTIDGRDYARASASLAQGKVKSFFQKQEKQKRDFNKMIEETLEKIKAGTSPSEAFSTGTMDEKSSWPGDAEISGDTLLQWSAHREGRNLKAYEELLANINRGYIREMLLAHKHQIQLSLQDLERMAAEGTD